MKRIRHQKNSRANVIGKRDLCRAIDTNDSLAQALDSMNRLVVKLCY